MNTELFRKIEEKINAAPEALDMDSWETSCGTTYCMAGWAIHLTTGAPIYGPDGEYSDATVRLAADLGTVADTAILGGRLLGLDVSEWGVFYVTNGRAKRFIHFAALGQDDLARKTLRDEE